MQHHLKQKLLTELKKDSRNFSWFYLKYLQKVTTLNYQSVMHQLDGKYPLNKDVEEAINEFIKASVAKTNIIQS